MNRKFPKDNRPIKLYRNPKSGHCHRVELMLSFLDLPYETIELDMMSAEHKGEKFLALNPFGQVPVIDDNQFVLADSNAIIIYLNSKYNDGYEWYPQSIEKAAKVQRWLSVAAGEVASGPCAARLVTQFGVELDYGLALAKTQALFEVMEPILQQQNFLVEDAITLADIACYSYIAHVPEGGFSLAPFPAILDWLKRIEAQPRFVGMIPSEIPSI